MLSNRSLVSKYGVIFQPIYKCVLIFFLMMALFNYHFQSHRYQFMYPYLICLNPYWRIFLTNCVRFGRLYVHISSFLSDELPMILERPRYFSILFIKEHRGEQQCGRVVETGWQWTCDCGHVKMNAQDVAEVVDLTHQGLHKMATILQKTFQI